MNILEQASDPNTPPKVLEQLATDKNWQIRLKVAYNSNINLCTLRRLLWDIHPSVRNQASRNPNYKQNNLKMMNYLGLPPKELESNYITSDPPDDSWEFIEWTENASIELLEQFITKNQEDTFNGSIFFHKIKNLIHSLGMLFKFDKEWYVRCWVAENPNTPPKVLEQLADDEDPLVRWRVARNPNTPPKTLSFLSRDKIYYVREEASQKHFLIMMWKIIR